MGYITKNPRPGVMCPGPKGAGCGNVAGFMTDHLGFGPCKFHGGNTKASSKKWAPEVQKAKLEKAMTTYGGRREIDPHTALREELWRTAGVVSWLEAEVQALETNEVTHLIVTNDEAAENGAKLKVIDERANELVKLYQQERKHFVEISKTCISCGIQKRAIEIAESQAQMINAVLRATLIDCGVDVRKPEVLAAVRRRLTEAARQLGGGDVIDGTAHAA